MNGSPAFKAGPLVRQDLNGPLDFLVLDSWLFSLLLFPTLIVSSSMISAEISAGRLFPLLQIVKLTLATIPDILN